MYHDLEGEPGGKDYIILASLLEQESGMRITASSSGMGIRHEDYITILHDMLYLCGVVPSPGTSPGRSLCCRVLGWLS